MTARSRARRRRIARIRRLRRPRILHVVAALAALAACTPRTDLWTPAESPKRNLVDWVEFHHAVAFGAGSATLSPTERQSLDRFIGRIGQGRGVSIAVAASGPGSEALRIRREAAVADRLRRRGLAVRLGAGSSGGTGPATVSVTVGRYVVTPPACPDWTKPTDGDPANVPSSNFGCATTANLGLMVADPGALLAGYATGPGDGETLARGVQDYHEGKSQTAPAAGSLAMPGAMGGGSGQ